MNHQEIVMCVDCAQGHYHNYNGVWLCQYCGQPKEKPQPEPVETAPRPTRRKKVTND